MGARLWAPRCVHFMRQRVGSDTQGLCGIWKEGAPWLGLLPEGRETPLPSSWEES